MAIPVRPVRSSTAAAATGIPASRTIFHGKQAAVELIVRVLAAWPKLGHSGYRAVFEVEPNTVLHWLVEAAERCGLFMLFPV